MSVERLVASLTHLQAALAAARFPLDIPGADAARAFAGEAQNQIVDYLLPRLGRLDAPLLAVVGGSTGAGKSTLVNSLIGREVSAAGVIRPTTRSSVLIHHPDDARWFTSGQILPGLARSQDIVADPRVLQLVPEASLPKGLAILDAPDVDSVVAENRVLAAQLLAAADLWMFVTSAARYADAVPWEYLAEAAHRNTVVSVIVNRCPPGAVVEIAGHLAQMLAERGLAGAKLFAVAERALPSDGMLPAGDVSGVKHWLTQLAAESEARSQVAVQSLAGTVRSIDMQLSELIDGVRRQRDALAELRRESVAPYQRAAAAVAEVAGDGSLLRGEILSRWQDLVGTGEFMRSVEERIGHLRDRLSGWFRGEAKEEALQAAISDTLTAVLREAGDRAAEETSAAWSLTRWGRDIVAAEPGLQRASAGFHAAAADAVRAWQSDVLRLVDEQGRGKRMKARFLAIGTNLAGLALIVVVFASTGGLTTAEVGIAGGTSLLAQRLLEAVFGEDAVRRLADHARRQLADRVDALLADEAARFTTILDSLAVDADATDRLEGAAAGLRDGARAAFDDLTAPELD